MRTLYLLVLIGFLSVSGVVAQKEWHYGAYYSFGAAFNLHNSNDHLLKPTDGSNIGIMARLDNGNKSLGFQAGLGIKWNDVRHKLEDNFYLDNNFRSWELRLQIVTPAGKKSRFALGLAPRLVYKHDFSLVYLNSANGAQSEYDIQIKNDKADLNELNSAIIFSWQYELHKHWFFHLNVDQDIQTGYAVDVLFENYDSTQNDEVPIQINSLLAGISGSIVFLVK